MRTKTLLNNIKEITSNLRYYNNVYKFYDKEHNIDHLFHAIEAEIYFLNTFILPNNK